MKVWIARTFKARDVNPVMILLKSLFLSRLGHCCTLTAVNAENVHRTFPTHINSVKRLTYWKLTKSVELYTLELRREVCIIVYTWKILERLVPNHCLRKQV